MKKFLWVFFSVLLLVGVFLCVDRAALHKAYVFSSFYFILLLTLAWTFSFFSLLKGRLCRVLTFLKRHVLALSLILVICFYVFCFSPPRFRVLGDETNLAGVSYSLAKEARADQIQRSMMSDGRFNVLNRTIPARPLLFPFLSQVIHRLTGYRAENVFVLNGILFFILLLLSYQFVASRWGVAAGCGAVFLIAAQPIIALTATSGGYDLAHCLFLFISFLALLEFLQRRDSASLWFLVLSLLMLSHIRHEGPVFFLLSFCLLILFRCIPKSFFCNPYFPAMGLCLLPLLWQRHLTGYRLTTQLPAGDSLFSFYHFWDTNIVFLRSIFRFDFYLPLVGLIFILAFGGASFFLITNAGKIKRRLLEDRRMRILVVVVSLNLIALWAIQTAWYWSRCTSPGSARFYVMVCFVASIVLAICLAKASRRLPPMVLLVGAIFFLTYFPVAAHGNFLTRIKGWREHALVSDMIRHFPDKDFILISVAPSRYAIYGCGAVTFAYAKSYSHVLLDLLRERRVGRILVLQRLSGRRGSRPIKAQRLPRVFNLKPLVEFPLNPRTYSRLSQVCLSTESKVDETLPVLKSSGKGPSSIDQGERALPVGAAGSFKSEDG